MVAEDSKGVVPMTNGSGPSRRSGSGGREPRLPNIDDSEIQNAVSTRIHGRTSDDSGPSSEDATPADRAEGDHPDSSPSDAPSQSDHDLRGDDSDRLSDDSTDDDDDGFRPYIKITPAREQVTPDHVVKGLYGLYRAGSGREMPFHLERRLSFVSTQRTFEFLIHKPADTRRFDFYLGVRPYEVEALEHLAANVRAMYPESFHFEIVPFATTDIFVDDVEPAGATLADLAAFEGIDELVELDGFEPDLLDTADDTGDESRRGSNADPTPPAMVRWEGVETKNNDWMTLLSQFSEISVDIEDSFRSP
ncbi:hypothetical protein ACFQL4_28270 [Halosimplex aquaticum]